MKIKAILFGMVVIVGLGCMYIVRSHSQDNSWIEDLGYRDGEISALKFNRWGKQSCPVVPVCLKEKRAELIFDTGCSTGIAITNAVESSVQYKELSRIEQLNRDGTHRGWSKKVLVDEVEVFSRSFSDVEMPLVDWKMMSSKKFEGLVGLEYFEDRVVTLDYASGKLGVKDNELDYSDLEEKGYIILPLVKSSEEGLRYIPFFRAKLDDQDIVVYMDTGKNHSYILSKSNEGKIGNRRNKKTTVSLEIGGKHLTLEGIEEVTNIAQAKGLPYPTRIELNSDQIWKNNLLVTFDLKQGNMILRQR